MYREWLSQFPTKKFDKDIRLFIQGDELDCCYYLTKGICSQLINYENGVEIIAKYHFPGELLNIWGVLKNRTACSSTVAAKTDTRAIIIPISEIRKKLDEDFAFYRWVVEPLLESNQYVYEQYQKKARGNAAEILCYTILALNQVDSKGRLYLPKCFSFSDLSQHLRIHRITILRIFKALQEEEVIRKYELGWLILKEHDLREYAGGNKVLAYSV